MATGKRAGRLHDQISPYLRSHAYQDIDWFPWGGDAFEEAIRRDCPVMISIGYHTCHWCHVMSRESFDDPEVAALINDTVVAIKVDREEHPDVDQAYLAQASAYTENLGWPLTIFATPQGHTFYAATYLPPEPREGLPSLTQVVQAVGSAWREKKDEVLESAKALVEAIAEAQTLAQPEGASLPDADQLAAVAAAIAAGEDTEYGGLGGAPKFPMAPVVLFLQGLGTRGNQQAAELSDRLLEAYASSPLRDPLEGGFFRYATSRNFHHPHYERMLYDNAGLLEAYSRAGMTEVAAGIVSFLRETLLVDGALASAQDSESVIEGVRVEGGYYLADSEARAKLTPPAVDTKIITGWNGLALCGLAQADRHGVPGDPAGLAAHIARWLIEHHQRADGSLVRVSESGRVSEAPATSEDYGGFALGMIELGLATGELAFIEAGRASVEWFLEHGSATGGDAVLASRGVPVPTSVSEGASPSGPALLARALHRLNALTGQRRYRDAALGFLRPLIGDAMLHPLGHGGVLRAVSELSPPPRELVVVGENPGSLGEIATTWQQDGAISLVLSPQQAQSWAKAGYSLLEGRDGGSGALAYACEGGVCALPVDDEDALLGLLAR